jgi:hypothetical protein
MLSKPETATKQAAEAEIEQLKRTTGMAFAAIFYFASGLYYLAFPIVSQDLTQVHLLAIGVISIIAGYLLLKPQKWGLWLGLLLFPGHIVTPAYGFQVEFNIAGALTSPLDVIFLASLIVLIFFASVTFLVLLDQRRNFMPPEAKPAKK